LALDGFEATTADGLFEEAIGFISSACLWWVTWKSTSTEGKALEACWVVGLFGVIMDASSPSFEAVEKKSGVDAKYRAGKVFSISDSPTMHAIHQ
jgi:hypothetical protein